MANSYRDPDLLTDPDAIEAEATDSLTTAIPGLRLQPASLALLLIRAFAPLLVEQRTIMAQGPPGDVFDLYGANLARIPRIAPTAARGLTTWAARDTSGPYTIEEDTQLAIGDVTFLVEAPATIPAGVTTVTDVSVVAAEPGAFANDLAGDVTVISRQAWMESATLQAPTALGSDGETDDVYRDRLARENSLRKLMPILPEQFAALALRVVGVARVVVLDGYDDVLGTDGHARTVTIVAVAPDGTTPAAPILAEIIDTIEPLRGVNWAIYARGAWYTDVDATYTARALPGFDPVALKTAADQAVRDVLDPARFGLPDDVGDASTPEMAQVARTLVPIGEVYQAVEDVDGIDYCSDAQLGPAGGTLASQSLALAGRVALPRPGTVSGTVTAAP